MLQPKRRKYRKEQKGRNTGVATRGSSVAFGDFGLKAVGRGRLTARQIESARRAMTRHIKRGGRIWIRIFWFCILIPKNSAVLPRYQSKERVTSAAQMSPVSKTLNLNKNKLLKPKSLTTIVPSFTSVLRT